MIVRIQCAVAFGSWQLGEAGQWNDGISCQNVAEPMKSLCRGENAPMGSRHRSLALSLFLPVFPSLSLSLYPLSPIPLSSLSLSVYLSQHPLHLLTLRARSLFFSLISFRRCFVGRGGENNQRKFDGNTRITSDHEMRSDTFEYRLYARPRQHVEESRSTINQQTRYHDA